MSNTGKKRGNSNGHRNENKKTSKTPQTQTEIQPQQISEVLYSSTDLLYGQHEINPHSVLSNLLQLMPKKDTRLNSIEKKVTKSVDQLDEIKTSIKSVTQNVSTVEREVTTLKQKHTQIEVHTQGISNLFDETKEASKENDTEIMNIAVTAKLAEMKTDIRKLKNEREKMKESLLDLKCRAMKKQSDIYWFEGNTV